MDGNAQTKTQLWWDRICLYGVIEQHQIYRSIEPITIGDISIPPTSSARNIGVIFDSTFQMEAQIGKVCQACYFWQRNIRRVRSQPALQLGQSLVINLKTGLLQLNYKVCSQDYSAFKMRPQE